MLHQIRVDLTPTPHPYSGDPGVALQLWGRLAITIVEDEGTQVLCETEWDLAEFAEWFVENQETICSEYLITGDGQLLTLPKESLAQALNRLQKREFDDEELELEWFSLLYNFRSQHVLTFAMRGSRIPAITIGCNAGSGEISLVNESANWSYLIDMDDFLTDLRDRLRALVFDWSNQADGAAYHRALNILERLNGGRRRCCPLPDDSIHSSL